MGKLDGKFCAKNMQIASLEINFLRPCLNMFIVVISNGGCSLTLAKQNTIKPLFSVRGVSKYHRRTLHGFGGNER